MEVTFDAALHLTKRVYEDHFNEKLSADELAVIKGAWEDIGYEDIAKTTAKTHSRLRSYTGRHLWIKLAEAFDIDKMTKKGFRTIVEKRLTHQRPISSRRSLSKSDAFTVLGGQPPRTDYFFGRKPEIAFLKESIKAYRCVTLTGPPGVGKSCLAAQLVKECSSKIEGINFSHCIWKSLSYSPSLKILLKEMLGHLGIPSLEIPNEIEALISELMRELNSAQYLIVLDSVEGIMEGDFANQFGPNEDYRLFFSRIILDQHNSCIILTSQEPINQIEDQLEEHGFPALTYKLGGLGKDSHKLLRHKGLEDETFWPELISSCRGNPLALSMISSNILEFFSGNVQEYLSNETIFINNVLMGTIKAQLERSSELEQKILLILSGQESASFQQLRKQSKATSLNTLIVCIKHLESRSMIEQSSEPNTYTIMPVIKKYLLNHAQNSLISEKSFVLFPQ